MNTDDAMSKPNKLDDLMSASDDVLFSEEDTVRCHVCNHIFNVRGLEKHFNTVHTIGQNLNKTTCGLCLKTFRTKVLLRNHQVEVHGGKAYGCDLCGKQTANKKDTLVHIMEKHVKSKTFMCEICGAGYPFQYRLTKHINNIHRKIRNQHCHLCEMKFHRYIDLRDHIRAAHTLEQPFKCEVEGCIKSFSRNTSLIAHRRVHSDDKFECNICMKHFSFKANMNNHKRNKHGVI